MLIAMLQKERRWRGGLKRGARGEKSLQGKPERRAQNESCATRSQGPVRLVDTFKTLPADGEGRKGKSSRKKKKLA